MLALSDPTHCRKTQSARRHHAHRDGQLSSAPVRPACIEGFFGGSYARALEDAGDGALAAQAIDEIAALLGSDFARN